jgi:ABC-type hemin transport system ATPase subunit
LIAVKNLSLSLAGVEILKGLDFVLPFSENLVILGRSGPAKRSSSKACWVYIHRMRAA